jgi:hypothetical protein
MTKSAKLLSGSTLAGPDIALLPEVEGQSFAEWLVAAASSRDGVSRLEIQARAGQGPRAWRPYADQVAKANAMALVVGGGKDENGGSNNHPGDRYRAKFWFVAPERAARLPLIGGAEVADPSMS